MAVLGNRPSPMQSVGQNATNTMRQGGYDISRGSDGRHVVSQGGRVVGQPIGVAYGTPRANYQRFLDAGTPLVFGEKHTLGTNTWSPGTAGSAQSVSGPSMPQQTQQPGQQPGAQPGMGNIRTSITPKSIYPPWMTEVATNTVQAQADQASNAPYLMKMFDRPGVSRGDASFAAIAPLVAENQVNAATARASIPFEDAMANERNLFLGQVGRENESLQLGNLLARIAEANQQSRLSQMGRASSLLSGLVG